MEEIPLTEAETRYYGDLFLCSEEEKTGKIPLLKALGIFRCANLSDEKILEITSLVGIPDTALYVSRVQFYSCLKLIASYQALMPLSQEVIASSVQLPLPRFSWKDLPSNKIDHHALPSPLINEQKNSIKYLDVWPDSNAVESRRNSLSRHEQESIAMNSYIPCTDSDVEQGESYCGSGKGEVGLNQRVSPEAWSTNSDSPTPTNSVADRPWVKETLWHGLSDEHKQLLGTEEESSDRHSSDDENGLDLESVYQITQEQREYYFNNFKAVQHDPNGLLSGQVARVFFEKSRIPVEELRHIWQICDVTRDGALSLFEFTAAMHLVVLRRNNIHLPATLPSCLHPNMLQEAVVMPMQTTSQSDPPEADLLHLDVDDDENNTNNTIIVVKATKSSAVKTCGVASVVGNNSGLEPKNDVKITSLLKASQANVCSSQGINVIGLKSKLLIPPAIPPVPPLKAQCSLNKLLTSPTVPQLPPLQMQKILNSSKVLEANTKTSSPPPIILAKDVHTNQWTKFIESPTSNVSSPGPKPVNFDMQRTAQAVVSDPHIFHPVPLRVTPIGGVIKLATNFSEKNICESSEVREYSPVVSLPIHHGSESVYSSQSNRDFLQNKDLRAIQRPQPKKFPKKTAGAIPPPPQRDSVGEDMSNVNSDNDTIGVLGSRCNYNLSVSMVFNKKDQPPLPPPRPHRHGRSSSLDLNRFKIAIHSGIQSEVIAQTSFDLQTSTGFADFANFPEGGSVSTVTTHQPQENHSLPPQNIIGRNIITTSGEFPPTYLLYKSGNRASAFEVYRKPNTSRSSQTPTLLSENATISGVSSIDQPPSPFGSEAASAMTTRILPNSEQYEKRVNVISEKLRQQSFKQANSNMAEVLSHLHEQNSVLLCLCNDLSDELLIVQTHREEIRLKLETNSRVSRLSLDVASNPIIATSTIPSISLPGSLISNYVSHQPQEIHSLPPQSKIGRNIVTTSGEFPPTYLLLKSDKRASAFEVYRKPNTLRSSQTPTLLSENAITSEVSSKDKPPSSFGPEAASAMTTTILPNSEKYEKRVAVISEKLRQQSFNQANSNMAEVLSHLREQNSILLCLCNDLSGELLIVQTCKEKIRLKLQANSTVSSPCNDEANKPIIATSTMPSIALPGSLISNHVNFNITGASSNLGVHSNT